MWVRTAVATRALLKARRSTWRVPVGEEAEVIVSVAGLRRSCHWSWQAEEGSSEGVARRGSARPASKERASSRPRRKEDR
jgi:hypothetical protein